MAVPTRPSPLGRFSCWQNRRHSVQHWMMQFATITYLICRKRNAPHKFCWSNSMHFKKYRNGPLSRATKCCEKIAICAIRKCSTKSQQRFRAKVHTWKKTILFWGLDGYIGGMLTAISPPTTNLKYESNVLFGGRNMAKCLAYPSSNHSTGQQQENQYMPNSAGGIEGRVRGSRKLSRWLLSSDPRLLLR